MDQYIFEFLNLIESAVTVITLVLAIATIRANTKERRTQTVHATYDNFQDLSLALLTDEGTLEVLADVQGKSKTEVRKQYLGSIFINNAYKTYHQYQQNLLPEELWERSKIDMRGLFSWGYIYDQWSKKKSFFPKDFQDFIQTEIITVKPSKFNHHESASNPRNC